MGKPQQLCQRHQMPPFLLPLLMVLTLILLRNVHIPLLPPYCQIPQNESPFPIFQAYPQKCLSFVRITAILNFNVPLFCGFNSSPYPICCPLEGCRRQNKVCHNKSPLSAPDPNVPSPLRGKQTKGTPKCLVNTSNQPHNHHVATKLFCPTLSVAL